MAIMDQGHLAIYIFLALVVSSRAHWLTGSGEAPVRSSCDPVGPLVFEGGKTRYNDIPSVEQPPSDGHDLTSSRSDVRPSEEGTDPVGRGENLGKRLHTVIV